MESVSHLEERLNTDHGHLSSLQAQILNVTKWNSSNNSVKQEQIQDSRLAALEEKLEEHLEVSVALKKKRNENVKCCLVISFIVLLNFRTNLF